jgi:adenosylmethionine-8-amino-7-oxononanoate aminotransferase
MDDLVKKDREFVWHPYTQHGFGESNLGIVKGKDALLFDEKGNAYIDIISSWWVNLHGHSHPHIAKKITEQLHTLEHVIFAGFTHPPAVSLAERLLAHLPENQSKIFFSDNGSTAVEVALKMSIQYWQNRGENKKKIISFHQAYHGDTFGAMSVSGRSAFTKAFVPFLFEVEKMDPPFACNEENTLAQMQKLIDEDVNSQIAAFIYEPLVMGTAGMKMYSAEVLDRLLLLCKENNILCIADEVMTGFGRTAKFFASDYMVQKPDMVCLSKGLTAGTLPMGITSCTEEIYKSFYSEDVMKTFFHGHSFTANPIGCAAALASLDLMEEENTFQKIEHISEMHAGFVNEIKDNKNVLAARSLGTIMAIEIRDPAGSSYFSKKRGALYAHFLSRGIIARPLGNIMYAIPPYCISDAQLEEFYAASRELLL